MDKGAQYFIDIKKAYTDDSGRTIVQGVASGTLEDIDGQRVSLGVLEKFAKHINDYSLPLTNGHQVGGAIDDELGELTFAQVLYNNPTDGTHSLFVKGLLDMDNPNSQYLVKSVNKGKQVAFSLFGIEAMTKSVWSDKLKAYIDEFVDVTPREVTVTTKPSYTPSFLEVLTKSESLEKSEGYTGYPTSAKNNAKKVLAWKEEHGNEVKGMTSKGWARAAQIAAGKSVSRSDLGSIASFARHKENAKVSTDLKSTPWKDAGHVAWLGWGGASMINWAQKKLDSLKKSYNEDRIARSFKLGDEVKWESSKGILSGVIQEYQRNDKLEKSKYIIETINEEGETTGEKLEYTVETLNNLNITKSYMSKKEDKELKKSIEEQAAAVETQDESVEDNTKVVATEDVESEATEETATEGAEAIEEIAKDAEVETDAKEATEESEEDLAKSYDKRKVGKSTDETALSTLVKMVDGLVGRMEMLEKTMGSHNDKLTKSFEKTMEEQENVLRSMHEDLEKLKETPLQRKALVKSSDFGDRKEQKKSIREKLLNN